MRVYGSRAGAIDAIRGAKALCTRLRPFSSGLGFCLECVACSLLQGLGAYRGWTRSSWATGVSGSVL